MKNVKLSVDFNNRTGTIKPMHAVGQPPLLFSQIRECPHFHYLSEANIPYSRLHDVGGSFGGGVFVDIPNLFRDFDADENDPASYDFIFTDLLIKGLYEHHCAPVFRLGVTIENCASIQAYRIYPPKDFAKWARICEHVIRHYNEGWADGFHYGIRYWEIWNEPEYQETPELNQMWQGTDEEFFKFYTVASKHLKACFGDSILVGGYASCGTYSIFADPEKYGVDPALKEEKYDRPKDWHQLDFFFKFLDYIKAHDAPLEFFSWHSYTSVVKTVAMAEFIHRTLCEYGYGNVESHLNEWNNTASSYNAAGRCERGTSMASAQAAAMILAMQNEPVDMLCYYDARIGHSVYGGLFNPITYEPFCTYYAFVAFGQLYALGQQVSCACNEKGLYAVAATDGEHRAVMITNVSGEDMEIETGFGAEFSVELVDETHLLSKTELRAGKFTLANNRVVLLRTI